MSAESAAGERFARDMRRIREDRGVSPDDIHEETRIAITLIAAFEQDGLFEHPAFNRVYLRSFVRAYAGCIDLDPDLALKHLERALTGAYENELTTRILETTPSMGGYEVNDEEESPPDGDEPSNSPPVDRPLSKQEQEPPKFSPRPIGGTQAEATEDRDGDDRRIQNVPPDHLSERNLAEEKDPVDQDRTGENDSEARQQEAKKKDNDGRSEQANIMQNRTEEKEPDATEPSGDVSANTSSVDASSPEDTVVAEENADTVNVFASPADDPSDDKTGKEEPKDATGQDDDHDDSGHTPPSASSEMITGTAGGTVFNKRPMGSEDDDASHEDSTDLDTADQNTSDRNTSDRDTLDDRVVDTPTGTSEEDATHSGVVNKTNPAAEEATSERGSSRSDSASAPSPKDEVDESSPAQRFRHVTEGSEDRPPPPRQGEMVGKPRPIGSATDTTRTARDSSRAPMESPMAARSEKQSTARDLRVSEMLEENRTLLISGAAVVGILVVGLALWFAFSGDGDPQNIPSTADSQQAQPADQSTGPTGAPSSETNTTAPSQPPRANLALADTLQLVVEAQSDVLGMRIERDRDVRRPYWINTGETMAFPFTEQIVVWDNIENIDLYLERYRYPETQHLDARGRVVITRDSAEVFAQTIRGSEASFPTPTVRPLNETFPEPEPEAITPEETAPEGTVQQDTTSSDTALNETSR